MFGKRRGRLKTSKSDGYRSVTFASSQIKALRDKPSSPKWIATFPYSRASTDPNLIEPITTHFAEHGALAIPIRPYKKIIRSC
ncbi:hypothetical protein AGR3A_Lc180155 [Agrobacterium tomkonis CFBP 6623]|uniref:Uncharacterized protein n=1 Tax=Agrobacterium tomkonis CFBP 6623 TaxID=1183432 RepID=A0A1S7S2S6_9HYPH|nr:hypothetical protein AGR3A_Lc180155 [Agrobacterium tomkonis CFBP 6623]